ncbi:hypothetical protein [Candidatus Nanohalovita haloferacivicina]|uniref:hypothetical protein n=1 Tax=Candidatus Nanohalovita haloferacivicina TaxID=2978046 RepID=UPI00325FB115|nr:hypothetical protein HBNXNv_0331 [Candidatus Nanohalobia archaeon BNXNv]
MTVSDKKWSQEYSFLEPEDIDRAFIADTEVEGQSGPVHGFDREDIYFEFSMRRPLTVRELSPDLSTSILENYGFDPYSEDPFLDSEVVRTQEGEEFLRVGYRDNAVYFSVSGSSMPFEREYLDEESPRWRA